jgi:cell division protein FtsB
LGDEDSEISVDEPLCSAQVHDFLLLEQTVKKQQAEIELLRELVDEKVHWISDLVSEFTL